MGVGDKRDFIPPLGKLEKKKENLKLPGLLTFETVDSDDRSSSSSQGGGGARGSGGPGQSRTATLLAAISCI
jgi:hypothetical protein